MPVRALRHPGGCLRSSPEQRAADGVWRREENPPVSMEAIRPATLRRGTHSGVVSADHAANGCRVFERYRFCGRLAFRERWF